jgi:hypothetical protein
MKSVEQRANEEHAAHGAIEPMVLQENEREIAEVANPMQCMEDGGMLDLASDRRDFAASLEKLHFHLLPRVKENKQKPLTCAGGLTFVLGRNA